MNFFISEFVSLNVSLNITDKNADGARALYITETPVLNCRLSIYSVSGLFIPCYSHLGRGGESAGPG